MKVADVVYKNLEMITGLPESEIRNMPDLDLIKEELIDSLSMAELISAISQDVGKTIDLKQFRPESFSTISGLIEAVEKQCG